MSVEKVKTFTENKPEKLEKEVNEWLEKNNSIVIISRQVTNVAGTGFNGSPFITFTIFIFYRER